MTPLDRLTDEDARILRLEAGFVRGHTCKVVELGPVPDGAPLRIDDLRTHVAARIARFPRLRRRLAPTPLGLANPAWVDDPGFDVARHVVPHPAATERAVDEAGLRAIVAQLMTSKLDRDRPLWRVDVVGGLEGGGTALVVRVHHCLADGKTMARILSQVILDSEPPELEPAGARPAAVPSVTTLLALAARDRSRSTATAMVRGVRAVGAPGSWRAAAGTARRLPGTLRRELTPSGAETPLDTPAGPRRLVAFVSRPLDELHRISKSFGEGVTINDVVLTAVGGGLRKWLEEEGAPVGDLHAKVPVSLHRTGEDPDASANRDSFMVVDLALMHDDPVERLLRISGDTGDRKRHHDAEEIDALLHDLAHVSRSLERLAERWAVQPRVFAVNVSNVPGPRGELSLLGAPVRAVHSLAEVANRHALRVSVFSAAGLLSFGLCADAGVMTDIDALASGVEADLDALLARCATG